jgi:hypothetical protein
MRAAISSGSPSTAGSCDRNWNHTRENGTGWELTLPAAAPAAACTAVATCAVYPVGSTYRSGFWCA